MKVLIVDDHPVVRQGLKQIITEGWPDCAALEAGTAQEALDIVDAERLDVVLLDISLPGINGIDALKQIKRLSPRLPVLMISVYDEEVYAVRAIEAGAAGYITKNTASDELLQAIRTVQSGHKYIRPSVAEQLAVALDAGTPANPHEVLSDREYEVMLLLAEGKTVGEIAATLSLSPKTVSTYRVRALEKMGFKNNAELMRYAIEHGLSHQ